MRAIGGRQRGRAGQVTRRDCLAVAAVWTVSGVCASAAQAAVPHRLAVLDWGLAATVLSLGVTPIAVPAIAFYDRNLVDPVMPPGVVDVGLLFTPNFELLFELAPDLILIPPGLVSARSALARTGPVAVFNLNPFGGEPYTQARAETIRLAGALGRASSATALLAQTEVRIDQAKASLHGYDRRPVYVINMLDGQHIRIFGKHTLYQDVLDLMGVRNAWSRPSTFLPVGIEALTEVPDARIVIVASVGDMTTPAQLAASPFWSALPSVRAGRVHRIGSVFPMGGVPSAARFATLLSAALLQRETAHA
ncbi:ABC transporter substrate-binding protein [Acidisoma cellulosilytica]|uniref:ABC transporter substrate-binding protein n=1 Tax=Acidisoma cellulosilyticum TaxID=2802395 RepID=A0A963Z677_9PROT|nr:ABC transporter substrate-binding protein [Acidisoma cellulosilyticum]MCB8883597.1 ABC transporter substrate-binding protein [Acidisoma cellulosilyticum]